MNNVIIQFMNLEVEIKTKLDGSEISKILSFLYDRGAVLLEETIEEDHYFNSPADDFRETDEALRLRKIRPTGELIDRDLGRLLLTYKGPKIRLDSKTRREINIDLDMNQGDSLMELFRSLGFRESGKVIKTRREISYEGFVICLDRVEGLGNFMEIEKVISEFKLVDETVDEMKSLITGLAEKEWIRESYLEMCMKGGG